MASSLTPEVEVNSAERTRPRAHVSSPMENKLRALLPALLAAAFACHCVAETPASPSKNLIVPGKSIGDIKLGADAAKVERELGKPDYSEGAMGGKGLESWRIGLRHGEPGRPFQNPGEIALTLLKDMEHDSAAHPSPYLVTQIQTTSPRFATADGIAPGAALDAIRAKYPDIEPVKPDAGEIWPSFGAMEFFQDTKLGIAFAVRKRDAVCIQIIVKPAGDDSLRAYYPSAAQEYVIDDVTGSVGDIRLGMTAAKLAALLGKPDEKRDVADYGQAWRWRLPSQRKMEVPALCVYLRKLPDGALIADQIRVSSPEFMLTDKIFPGCPLKDALAATPHIAKLDSYDDERVDIYGDLRAGLLFEVRQTDSICTAIAVFPPPLAVLRGMGGRWLDLPPPPAGD